ncbi:MAG: transposase family protein [Proteobacteria bacterium]|nr:transposase family protein [Pseudomonadota bacterium]MBU1596109.1 transposase family protein [Pseudomonadota bacterium]
MMDGCTASQLADALGCTVSTLHRRASAENWPFEAKPGRGGGKLFPLATLPDAVRLALASAANATNDHEAATLKLRQELAARAAEGSRQGALSAFAALPEPRKRRAEARALIARLCTDFLATSGLPRRRGTELFASDYNTGRITAPDWTREQVPSLCAGSIRNWQKALDREGLARLAGNHGRHRLGTGKIDGNPELSGFCLGMLKTYPHSHATHLLEAMRARFGADKLPTLRAVQRWLAGWKARNAQLFTAVKNPDAWRSKYMAAGGDALGATRLNQRWEMDSTKGDMLLSDGTRHVIVGCIDVYSRRLTLHVSRSSSSAAVAATLRKSLLAWGVPEEVKTDNGSDYVSRHMTSLFLGLNIRQTLCAPFQPQQKPFIERVFGTFCRDLVELLAGYVGHSVAERKDIEARRSFSQRLMKQGEEALELRMTPGELQDFCDRWTEDVYARKPHSSLSGKSPWQMAAEWPHPVQRIQDERALDVLLLPAPGEGTRRVTKKGIRLDGGLYDHAALGGLEGRDVQVKLDEGDVGAIYVFDLDGPFLCRALCPEIAGVSRRDVALARKRRQQVVINEGKAMLRQAAKSADTKGIAQEILAARSAEAARVQALPRQAEAWDTPALTEAGIAARVTDAPAPLPQEQEDRLNAQTAALAAEMSAVRPVPETMEVRYARALRLEKTLACGLAVDPEALRWLHGYQSTPEYLGCRNVYEEFGDEWLPQAAGAGL